MADELLVTSAGKGRDLSDLLRRELGIPEHVLQFSVSFGVDDLVRVKCEYIPKERREHGE